jgi:hypothetical protein
LLAANQLLATDNAAALDGGTKAVAQRSHQKEVVVGLLELIAKYVQANCKNDLTIFLSSGFKAVATTKTTTPPLSETIRKVDLGPNSGEMSVTLVNTRARTAMNCVGRRFLPAAFPAHGLASRSPMRARRRPSPV